jgi:C4-dicarboxylate transporter DctM subunit
MPLIIIVGIISGIVTATEAGVIAIAYGLVYGFFIARKLKLKDIPDIIINSIVTTAVVMITIAAAGALSNVLVRMRFQSNVLGIVVNTIANPILGTLFLCFVLLILGMFLDPTVLIAMFAPTVLAIGNAFHYDPVFYGVVMVVIMQVGAITPPVGSFLFVSCSVGNLPIEKVVKPLLPFIFTVMIMLLTCFLAPGIVTLLPRLMS